jgi:hypothetical protein
VKSTHQAFHPARADVRRTNGSPGARAASSCLFSAFLSAFSTMQLRHHDRHEVKMD